jgi:outer membrane protein
MSADLHAEATSTGAPDPLSVRSLAPPSVLGSLYSPQSGADDIAPCRFDANGTQAVTPALSLADVVDRALCRNPQTRAAWASTRAAAAQVGVARSAFLPTMSGTLSASRNRSDGSSTSRSSSIFNQESAGLSASYVLYDFGARDASLQNALQALAATRLTQDATLQKAFFNVVQAYYTLFATRAAVDAARESERSTEASLKAATGRYEAGTGTPADRLQAQTAYSQAVFNRIQAEGAARNAQGALANTVGLDANATLDIAPPQARLPDQQFDQDIRAVIEDARLRRPDLAAAEAQVKAAQAGVAAARAAGLPSISVSTSASFSDTSISPSFQNQAIGITLSVPIFSGYGTTYRIQAAEAQVENQMALRDSLRLQIALDVWQAYNALNTGSQSVRSSADLVTSAEASARVALGRYQAGVGTIIDLLTAQTALANARQQNIQATYNWQIARAQLAQAMGRLDVDALGSLNRNGTLTVPSAAVKP